jgi:hypothetical protein
MLLQADSIRIVQTLLTHRHTDAAFDYMIHQKDPSSFPFMSVGAVLHSLDPQNPGTAPRRSQLINHALQLWRQSLSNFDPDPYVIFRHHRGGFEGLFGNLWKDFPPDEALSIAQSIVNRALAEPDSGTSSSYCNEVHFTSRRQDDLFQILHVLRHLDPSLAQSLVDSHDELASAVRRYPNGLETIYEESEAATKRLLAEGVTCQTGGGGYFLSGDPADFARQRRIIDAARSGDFALSIEDALDKFKEDTSLDAPNYAPKEFWPSTGAFRSTLYQAGRHRGTSATTLLEQIPDSDLRLFAAIELAAALAGICAPLTTSMKQPRPPDAPQSDARIIAASCSIGTPRAKLTGPPMRSPDGQAIRCPKCKFQPSDEVRWSCKCGHVWNTFWTAAKCPSCHFQWEQTGCPSCGEMSDHEAWYVSEP